MHFHNKLFNFYIFILDNLRKEIRRLLFTRCKKTEVNLRKYIILGGHYQIDLIEQPPQPKNFRREITLTTRKYLYYKVQK
jgi:hypothetical protein